MDVPYPPDYGAVIDIFYKIQSLHAAGCEIYLHCYEYGRGEPAELARYCKEVFYYKRPANRRNISLTKPYIIYSRRNNELLKNLAEIEAPILFEGIHTTYFIDHPALKNRLKTIRTHNIEHEYYAQLAATKSAGLLKIYYRREVSLLRKYELNLHSADAFLAISLTDSDWFRREYPTKKNVFIPAFHPYEAVESIPGSGGYCLYHGNLSHPENLEAAFFLLNEVIPKLKADFIIAGKKPTQELTDACAKVGCTLIADPDQATMDDLVKNAHIHVLPTFQRSGIKLKLVSALYGGRHVLVNEPMLHGSGLREACYIADGANEFISKINEIMPIPFTETDKRARVLHLRSYDRASNAKALLKAMNMA